MSDLHLDIDVTSPVPSLPDLAKAAAVARLASALRERGTRPRTADAIAVAVCDPSAARRQLEEPAQMRVSGGTLEVLYTNVWVPAVLPYPENPRMLPGLTYATESRQGRRSPLPPSRPVDDTSGELVMPPVHTADLIEHLDSQIRYLRDNNDLVKSVGDHGIREPLLLVPLAFEHTDTSRHDVGLGTEDEQWPTVLTSVDGNSRLAAAYQHLRLDPGEVMTKLIGDSRAIRQRVGNTLALSRADAVLPVEIEQALRSLSAPAAVVIGFRPDTQGRDLADAIRSRLGAIHVAPAKQWSSASKYDLLLNVSLEALQDDFDDFSVTHTFTGEQYHQWLAGNLTPEQAEAAGLDPEADLRAAALRWWFRDRDSDISRAIRQLDITGRVSPTMRANISAEGALRSFRSDMTSTEADNARRVLATLYQLDDLQGGWEVRDDVGLGSVNAALGHALAEIVATGRPGPHGRLLMILAFFWVARHRIVPLQTRGGMADRRKITDVITLMCRSEHGMRVLAQTVRDGRSGVAPRAVGPDGRIELNDGEEVTLTDDWIRLTWSAGRPTTPVADSPQKDLHNRTTRLVELVQQVGLARDGLREPLAGDGLPLVDTIGIEIELAQQILDDLDAVRDDVIEFRLISKRARHAGAPH